MDNQTAMNCRQQSIPADNVQPMESTEYEAPLLEDMDFSMFFAQDGGGGNLNSGMKPTVEGDKDEAYIV